MRWFLISYIVGILLWASWMPVANASIWSPCYEELRQISFFKLSDQSAKFRDNFRARIKRLSAQKRYQEIAWALLDFSEEDEAQYYLNLLKRHLKNDQVVGESKAPHGGSGGKKIVHLSSGIQVLAKSTSPEMEEEIASYEFSEMLGFGIMPVTVPRRWSRANFSFQYWVPNAKHAGGYKKYVHPNIHPIFLGDLMDHLIGYGDRHGENELIIPWNWGYGSKKRIVFIDFGHAFEMLGDEHSTSQDFIPDELLLETEVIKRLDRIVPRLLRSRLGKYIKYSYLSPVEIRRKAFLNRAKYAAQFDPHLVSFEGPLLRMKDVEEASDRITRLGTGDYILFNLEDLNLSQIDVSSFTLRAASGGMGGIAQIFSDDPWPIVAIPIPPTGGWNAMREYTILLKTPSRFRRLKLLVDSRSSNALLKIEWLRLNKSKD